mmetsp:Transcript_55090/g.160775  ORF Transcript_55090/g.160775 Transcript_55090/m.160775 type:complete len:142 (-) Transcript_55090:350-775(-)
MEKFSLIDDIPLPPRAKKTPPPPVTDYVESVDLFAGAGGLQLEDQRASLGTKFETHQRWVTVHTEDGDEYVEINPQRGPVWLNPDGYKAVHPKVGFMASGTAQFWGDKPWYEMTKTEREIVLLQVAKHQQYLKRAGVNVPH